MAPPTAPTSLAAVMDCLLPVVDGDCTPPPSVCPAASIQQDPPVLTIEKIAPDHPLVVGQDPAKRGADIQAFVSIPPVVFTWYEQVQDPPTCEFNRLWRGGGLPRPRDDYDDVIDQGGNSIDWSPDMEDNPSWEEIDGEIHCIQHVEILPEAITVVQAKAELNAQSSAWILNDLAEKYYEAYIHHPVFNLVPGMAQVSSGCDGSQICSAQALAAQRAFRRPGHFRPEAVGLYRRNEPSTGRA